LLSFSLNNDFKLILYSNDLKDWNWDLLLNFYKWAECEVAPIKAQAYEVKTFMRQVLGPQDNTSLVSLAGNRRFMSC
jgi:hypothetical protein